MSQPRAVISLAHAFPAVCSREGTRKDAFWAREKVDVSVAVLDVDESPVVGRMVRPECVFGAVDVEFRSVEGVLMRRVTGWDRSPARFAEPDRVSRRYEDFDYPSPPVDRYVDGDGVRPHVPREVLRLDDVGRFAKVRDYGERAKSKDRFLAFAESLRLIKGELWRPTAPPVWAVIDKSTAPNGYDVGGLRMAVVPVVIDYKGVESRSMLSETSAPIAVFDHRVPVEDVVASLSEDVTRRLDEMTLVPGTFETLPAQEYRELHATNAFLVGVSVLKAAEDKITTWGGLPFRVRSDMANIVADADEWLHGPAALPLDAIGRLASSDRKDWPSLTAFRATRAFLGAMEVAANFVPVDDETSTLGF